MAAPTGRQAQPNQVDWLCRAQKRSDDCRLCQQTTRRYVRVYPPTGVGRMHDAGSGPLTLCRFKNPHASHGGLRPAGGLSLRCIRMQLAGESDAPLGPPTLSGHRGGMRNLWWKVESVLSVKRRRPLSRNVHPSAYAQIHSLYVKANLSL